MAIDPHVVNKYTITVYRLVNNQFIIREQHLIGNKDKALKFANDSDGEYIVVNNPQGEQVFTKGTMPVVPPPPEAKPIQ